jgi:hypothetical protein
LAARGRGDRHRDRRAGSTATVVRGDGNESSAERPLTVRLVDEVTVTIQH